MFCLHLPWQIEDCNESSKKEAPTPHSGDQMVKRYIVLKLSTSLFPKRSKEINIEEWNQELTIHNLHCCRTTRKTLCYKVISIQGLPSQEYRRDRIISVPRQFTASFNLGLFYSSYKFNRNFGFQTLFQAQRLQGDLLKNNIQLLTTYN